MFTGLCTGYFLPRRRPRGLLASFDLGQPHEQLLYRVGLRMHVAHSRLNAIVSGHILQGKGVGVLAGLGQERVPQGVNASIGMSVNFFRSCAI